MPVSVNSFEKNKRHIRTAVKLPCPGKVLAETFWTSTLEIWYQKQKRVTVAIDTLHLIMTGGEKWIESPETKGVLKESDL